MGEENTESVLNSLLKQNAVLKEKNRQLEEIVLSIGQTKRIWAGTMAKMSHDIRTPLNAIVGFTSIAQEEKQNPFKTQDSLKQIEEATKYLLSLVNELIETPKEEAEQSFSLLQAVEDVERAFVQRVKDRNIHFVMCKSRLKSDAVIGNEVQVKQVFSCLLNNAFWMTEEQGDIRVQMETISENKNSAVIGFKMLNYGNGAQGGLIEKTFLPFEEEEKRTAAPKESENELAVINSLVTLLNGVIKVNSRAGEDTVLCVEIPLKLQVDPTEEKQSPDTQIKVFPLADIPDPAYYFEGQHILLAEDNELNSEIMENYLSQVNLQVDLVKDGQEAVSLFQNSGENWYSLILMDIRMPIMDGRVATKMIRGMSRKDAAQIPIIAMSADAYSEEIKYAQSIGMNEYLTKPIYKDILYQMLTGYLKR